MSIPQEGQIFEATRCNTGQRISIVELNIFARDCFLVSYTEVGKEFDLSMPAIELDASEWQSSVKKFGLRLIAG